MISKIKAIRRTIHQLNYILDKKHKRKLPRLFLCIFFTSIFELVGVTAILPFVYALIDTEAIMHNKYAEPVFNYFNITDTHSVLLFLSVMLVVLYLIKNAFLLFAVWYQTNFCTRIRKEITIKMLRSYLSRPYQFFLDTTIGEVSRGCGQDVSAVFSTVQVLFNLFMSLFTTLLIGIYMFLADPIIAAGTLAIAIIAVVILTKVLKPMMKRFAHNDREAARKQSDAFNQTIYGIKDLYVMGRQEMFVKAYDEACEDMRVISVKRTTVESMPNRLIETLFIAGFMGLVLFRLSFSDNPASFVPTLASFAVGALKVLPYIGGITNKVNNLVYNKPFIESAYKNMVEADEYKKQMDEYAKAHGSIGVQEEDDKSVSFEKCVEARNVFWKYSKGKEPVLTDANLKINKGEAIGFVGKSGAGKTTLADIMLGLLQPQKGSIYMDDVDIYSMKKTWARIVGYVPQSVFLLAGTIKENVAFGKEYLSDEDTWDALDKAQLGEFVRNLPDGLNSQVGERGVKLSGGQRQRIAIARALANKPEILVLDEATSALDNETETAIMESIDALHGQMTMIIVAHRLTTIQNCDRIYRIGDGIATEVSHEEVFG